MANSDRMDPHTCEREHGFSPAPSGYLYGRTVAGGLASSTKGLARETRQITLRLALPDAAGIEPPEQVERLGAALAHLEAAAEALAAYSTGTPRLCERSERPPAGS